MLKQHHQLFQGLFLFADMLVVSAAWVLAYYLRFEWGPIPAPKGTPPMANYLPMVLFVWVIWGVTLRLFGLYHVTRGTQAMHEVIRVTQASTLSVLVFMSVAFLFWEKDYSFSRGVFFYFWVLAVVMLVAERMLLRQALALFRARGYNQRHVLIIGSGELAQSVARKIAEHPGLGFTIRGFLAEQAEEVGRAIDGRRVIGTYADVQAILEQNGIDQVLIALPLESIGFLEEILKRIGPSMVDIKVIPDIYKFISLRGGIEDFDGMPVISLLDTPLGGWNDVLKRGVDMLLATTLILLMAPLFALIAAAIKLTSGGPVFYRQERMSLDGRTFLVWKFRTMRADAEAETGAVWASPVDPRRTALGTWLRRTSLDELPQLLNVLRGEMSLVGPRPERPVFIEQFRQKIPNYMLRHKVRAGMTGWAQVHGLRGNTSVEQRIRYDLYYIENWSLLLDFKILLLTLFRGFNNPNAY
ncbi:MAG TPA: undecaprenyl-phosphate glucose phosphotransferase [Candidatus Binatia bacterium]|nr:undecaprenyl-phosphate glucose phosphotransferase [Candidatus Binatia bacterium]